MLSMDEIETGSTVIHKNTSLRYTVVDIGDDEVLLSPVVRPRHAGPDGPAHPLPRGVRLGRPLHRSAARPWTLAGSPPGGGSHGAERPEGEGAREEARARARLRLRRLTCGDDGKEVFFHRSGLGANDYDSLSEGDVVEYVVQEGPRGPRAENVRAVGVESA